jgi:ribonuclease P protein subunit RPR2
MLLPLHQALDARDGGHSLRVTALAEAFARALRWDDLRVRRVRLGARLHDVGKLALSDTLLTKPGPLTDDERDRLREHPLIGAGMLESIPQAASALACVLYHHERWDGYGYPDGLAGEGIPLAARVFAIADTLDALTTDRPYRAAASFEQARAVIADEAGSQFDPDVARTFAAIPDERLEQLRSGVA